MSAAAATSDAFTDIDLPLDRPPSRQGPRVVRLADDDGCSSPPTGLSAFDRIVAARALQGPGAQPARRVVVRQHRATSSPTTSLALPDPNALVAVAATPLPVEVIVRGHITGVTSTSLWRQYADGARTIYGYRFPTGCRKNTELAHADHHARPPRPRRGAHDEPLTCAEVTERGLVDAELWDRVQAAALAVFARGRRSRRAAGLILADTKYEFGLGPDGELLLIDEVHTPDSSRFWEAGSYEERLAAGEEPESLDKEIVRRAYADAGYRGDGDPPVLDVECGRDTSDRYIRAYERLTGTTFERGSYPVGPGL